MTTRLRSSAIPGPLMAVGFLVAAAVPLAIHADGPRRVVVYSQPGCPPCAAMRQSLASSGVNAEIYDIQANPARFNEMRALGGNGTPFTWVEQGTDPRTGLTYGRTFEGASEEAVQLARSPLPSSAGPPPADAEVAPQAAPPADAQPPPPPPVAPPPEPAAPPPEVQALPQDQQSLLDRILQAPSFRQGLTSLFENVSRSLGSLLQALGPVPGAGQVSRFQVPNPAYLGYGRPGGYQPPAEGAPYSRYKSDVKPPQPIIDQSKLGTPGGGKPGDPFWARNCLCHANTGAAPGVAYQVAGICPIDLLPCEISVCGPIVRHDNYVSTIAECLRHSDAAHNPFGF